MQYASLHVLELVDEDLDGLRSVDIALERVPSCERERERERYVVTGTLYNMFSLTQLTRLENDDVYSV